jgi:splicing factor U2AF subunit
MYPNPVTTPLIDQQGNPLVYDQQFLKEHFEDFYEDIFDEFSKSGEIDELNVCDNVAEHLIGNVYVKFFKEEDAQKAMNNLKGRFYAGRVLVPEFSPVTDFREARCRQHEQTGCNRAGMCNFMHLKRPSNELGRQLFGRRWNQLMSFHEKKQRGRGGDSRNDGNKESPPNRNRSPDNRGRYRGKRNFENSYDDGFGNVTAYAPSYDSQPKRMKRDEVSALLININL